MYLQRHIKLRRCRGPLGRSTLIWRSNSCVNPDSINKIIIEPSPGMLLWGLKLSRQWRWQVLPAKSINGWAVMISRKKKTRTVWPATIFGNMEASATRTLSSPYTFSTGSTTPSSPKGAIRQLQAGWYNVSTRLRTSFSRSSSERDSRLWSRRGLESCLTVEAKGSVFASLMRSLRPRTRTATSFGDSR